MAECCLQSCYLVIEKKIISMDSPISAYMHGGKEVLKKTKLYFSEVEWLLLWLKKNRFCC